MARDPLAQRPADPSVRRLANAAEAMTAAEVLARDWRDQAAAIDRSGRPPVEALRALAQSGLLGMTVPQDFGGAGVPTVTVARVFFILGAADLALAQVPQNHFDFVDTLVQAAPEVQAFFYEEVLRGARFGNALAEPGRKSRRDLATTIVEADGGYRITGRKFYSTGALTADWVPVSALHADGRIRTAYVRRDAPGLHVDGDWNAFGQRATFSGTTVLDDVFVPRPHVVDRSRGHAGFLLAQFAGNQLIHAALQVGSAGGSLDVATELAGDDRRLRSWAARVAAARALVLRAARLVDAALAAVVPGQDQAIAAAIAVDEAKSLAYELGPEIAAGLPGFGGPDAVAAARRLDRHWRNARTHSLHDPVRWRQHQVADFHLNGRLNPDLAARFGLPVS